MKLTEAANKLGIAIKTAKLIFEERKGITKLRGCWYLNSRGLFLLDSLTKAKAAENALMESANYYMDETGDTSPEDQNVINAELQTIANSIDNIIQFVNAMPPGEQGSVHAELENLFCVQDETQLADIYDNITKYVHNNTL